MHRLALLLLAPMTLAGCGASDAYVREIDRWHAGRVERLRSETGWLTLAGLHKLEPGTHAIGSAAGSGIALTDAAPARLGTLTVGEVVEFRAEPGVPVTELGGDGGAVGAVVMVSDGAGDPTVLDTGRVLFHVIDRGGERFLRVRDRQSPTLAAFDGIDRYPVDPRFRTTARLIPGEAGATLAVTNILGQVAHEPTPGVLEFELLGETHRLRPTRNSDGTLFLVFADATSGRGSYGAGRFLSADAPDGRGLVELDFNRAYNPVCALSEHATCPLPPPGNRLGVAVEAGERYPVRGG